jgi:hypothetical protein
MHDMAADALLDCTGRGDGVLDQFAGSGTTILAAEKLGRIGLASNMNLDMSMSPSRGGRDRQSWKRRSPAMDAVLRRSAPLARTLRKAFGGEGARGGQMAAGPESGHA